MADLTGKTLANGYPNLVTIGATTDDNPTTGTLENGKGNNLTSVTFDGAVVVNESGGNNDFRVEGDTETNLIFADASADAVGIGTSSPDAPLTVAGPDGLGTLPSLGTNKTAIFSNANTAADGVQVYLISGNTAISALYFGDTDDGDISSIQYDHSGNFMTFETNDQERARIDSSGNVGIGVTTVGKKLDVNGEIRASGGILFGSDTAAANTLDDYEEGTWTPVYEPQTGSFTTMTMAVNSATYTKIGRQVTVQAWVKTSNVDVTGASGFLFIGGLPFTSLGSISVAAISVGNSTGWSSTANSPDSGVITASSTSIRLQKTNATAISVVSDLRTGAISDQNDLRFTATYFT